MGRNGMGKTTLIRSMLGIGTAAPRHGARERRRHDLPHLPHCAAGHGLRARGARHLPNLSVRENLLMAARAGGRRNGPSSGSWETFPPGQRINNGGGQLSGGEQQMLTIGRADDQP